MTKPKVFVTRLISENALDLIRKHCDVDVWQEELPPPLSVLIKRSSGSEGLLCLLTDEINEEVLAAAPRLKVVSNMAVGVDNIDIAGATRRGLPVGHTPGVLTDATADMTLALLFSAARRIVEGEKYVRTGSWKTWSPQLLLGADFSGATLGILGFGRIGQAVAKRAAGFGLRVTYHDPSQEPALDALPVGMDQLFTQSDFITLHIPLTEETRHLINSNTLVKFKANAILVNTARGGIVDHQALYEALKARRIFAAALDVTEPEPLPVGHPLLALDNCIITPHIASASLRTREKMAEMAAMNLIAGIKGERLPNCVNPEVYK